MKKLALLISVLVAIAACEQFAPEIFDSPPDDAATRPKPRPETTVPAPPMSAITVEQFDTTTDQERAEAAQASGGGERRLGRSVTSLGNPASPGFWLETPLVTKAGKGRVVYPATGNSVAVDLIPSGGASTAGSRISLPAMRLLGAPLTGLPELVIYAQ